MAVKPMNMADKFSGLSTDTKPTSGIYQGSTFIEIDTGDVYMFDGTQWVKQFSLQS